MCCSDVMINCWRFRLYFDGRNVDENNALCEDYRKTQRHTIAETRTNSVMGRMGQIVGDTFHPPSAHFLQGPITLMFVSLAAL